MKLLQQGISEVTWSITDIMNIADAQYIAVVVGR